MHSYFLVVCLSSILYSFVLNDIVWSFSLFVAMTEFDSITELDYATLKLPHNRSVPLVRVLTTRLGRALISHIAECCLPSGADVKQSPESLSDWLSICEKPSERWIAKQEASLRECGFVWC